VVPTTSKKGGAASFVAVQVGQPAYNQWFDVTPMFTTFLEQIEKRDAVARQALAEISEPF
jgi:hypothetical protein